MRELNAESGYSGRMPFSSSRLMPVDERKAFTLIELLVVVAIIAVLIAILLPSLGNARNQAKTTACQANFKSLGTALFTYAAEYQGNLFRVTDSGGYTWNFLTFGGVVNSGTPSATNTFVPTIMNGYLTSFKPWICPFIDNAKPIDARTTTGFANNAWFYSSTWLWFGFNCPNSAGWSPAYKFNTVNTFPKAFPAKMNQAPTDLPMMQDAYSMVRSAYSGITTMNAWNINHAKAYIRTVGYRGDTSNPSDIRNEVVDETMGIGANILFYDGSARFVTRNQMVDVSGSGTTATKSVLVKINN